MYVAVRVLLLFDGNLPLAFLMASLIGATLGSVNAFLIHRFKIPR